MGNSISGEATSAKQQKKDFKDVIDYIATYYILTMDFKSLSQLTDAEYCNKLVVLSSQIISDNFNDQEVAYLAQRTNANINTNSNNDLVNVPDHLKFINSDTFTELDIQNQSTKKTKERVCIGIAKFYVKIAHVFASILMTINPVYSYKNDDGEVVKSSLLDRDNIPRGVKRKIARMNICDNRIKALKRGKGFKHASEDNKILQPNVCDFNLDKETGLQKSLSDEPGIAELYQLYMDDKYDYSTGQFTGMSDATKEKFHDDLKSFYKAFTGNNDMPNTIKTFADIKLRDFSKGCTSDTPGMAAKLNSKIELPKDDKRFEKYGQHLKDMIQRAADTQSKLLGVINKLFVFVDNENPVNPELHTRKIRVNPELNNNNIQAVVDETRNIIVELYIGCENDYLEGVKIYESLVEKIGVSTLGNQIDYLEREKKELTKEEKEDDPIPAVVLVPELVGDLEEVGEIPASRQGEGEREEVLPLEPEEPDNYDLNTYNLDPQQREQLDMIVGENPSNGQFVLKPDMNITTDQQPFTEYPTEEPAKLPLPLEETTPELNIQETPPLPPAPIQEAPLPPAPIQETPLPPAPIQQTPIPPAPIQETPLPQQEISPQQEMPIQETPTPPAPIQEAPLSLPPPPIQQTPIQQAPIQQTPIQQAPYQQETPIQQEMPIQQAPYQQEMPIQQAPPEYQPVKQEQQQQPLNPLINGGYYRRKRSPKRKLGR